MNITIKPNAYEKQSWYLIITSQFFAIENWNAYTSHHVDG